MSKDNGGSAFPIVTEETNENGVKFTYVETGMSLRDWLAGQALAGLLSGASSGSRPIDGDFAGTAYRHADAMLAERNKS